MIFSRLTHQSWQEWQKHALLIAQTRSFLIISNPVNSTVPIFAEVLKRMGAYNPKKLFGVTTLDVVRANTFVGQHFKLNPARFSDINVNVIGGHAGATILPLLSQVKVGSFSQKDIESLTHRVMFGGDEVVKAKAGSGSATLSMAYAGAVFAASILKARGGNPVVRCSFVQSDACKEEGISFFASPVRIGAEGIQEILPLPQLSGFEKEKYTAMLPELREQIKKGIEFGKTFPLK
jgi:malate dehydrogenase